MRRIAAVVALACLGSPLASIAADEGPAARTFEKMHALAGEWEGTYEWSGGRSGGGDLRVRYELVAHGSAIVETLVQDGEPSMVSVYHLDDGDLRMTHYCGAQNQPRLKATSFDEPASAAEFTFVDVTNAAKHPAYVTGFRIQLVDANHLELRFTFGGSKGTSGLETIRLARSKPAGA